MRITSELYVVHGVPHAIVPSGLHVFPADAAALVALRVALDADLGRVDWVSDAEIARGTPRRFELPALRAFLDERRAAIAAHWDAETIRANTRRRAHERVDALRELHAVEIVVSVAEATLDEVSRTTWDPSFDLDLLSPDVCGAASLVDACDPRYVEVDVSAIVGIALLACLDADASSVAIEEDVEGTPLVPEHESESREGGVTVRAGVYDGFLRLEALEIAHASAPNGAWLIVET